MKILIVKTSALGDILHAFPTLHYLRNRFKEAKIDWVVERSCAELLEAHPMLDATHIVDTRAWRKGQELSQLRAFYSRLREQHYDLLFDLQGNSKSALITLCARAKEKVGFAVAAEWPNLLVTHHKIACESGKNIREDYLNLVRGYFGDREPLPAVDAGVQLQLGDRARIEEILAVTGKRAILVCPGSRWKNKELPNHLLLHYLDLLKRDAECKFLLAWGSPGERAQVEALKDALGPDARILPKLTLPELQNLMGRVSLVIAMDSLPLHLAATTGVATVSFFGPSSAGKYAPVGPQHKSYSGSCPYGLHFEKRCPKLRTCPTGACLQQLDPTAFTGGSCH